MVPIWFSVTLLCRKIVIWGAVEIEINETSGHYPSLLKEMVQMQKGCPEPKRSNILDGARTHDLGFIRPTL